MFNEFTYLDKSVIKEGSSEYEKEGSRVGGEVNQCYLWMTLFWWLNLWRC